MARAKPQPPKVDLAGIDLTELQSEQNPMDDPMDEATDEPMGNPIFGSDVAEDLDEEPEADPEPDAPQVDYSGKRFRIVAGSVGGRWSQGDFVPCEEIDAAVELGGAARLLDIGAIEETE